MSGLTRFGTGLFLVAGLLSAPLGAQTAREQYEKKLAREFVQKIPWKMTLAEAMAEAGARQKLILAYFTRSYAP